MITPFNLMGRTHALCWQSSDRKLPQDNLSLQTLTIMRYEPFRGPTAHTQIHNRAKHSKKHHFQVLPDRYGPKKPHESLRFFSTIFRTDHAHNLRSYNCSTFNYGQSYATYLTHHVILAPEKHVFQVIRTEKSAPNNSKIFLNTKFIILYRMKFLPCPSIAYTHF